jgi:hypothetical protein
MYRRAVRAGRLLPVFAGPRIQQIEVLAYVKEPDPCADRNMAENRAAIPLVMNNYTLKDRDNGSLFRYIQKCNGIRDNNGT